MLVQVTHDVEQQRARLFGDIFSGSVFFPPRKEMPPRRLSVHGARYPMLPVVAVADRAVFLVTILVHVLRERFERQR